MYWKEHPEAIEIIKKYGLLKQDEELVKILQAKFPNERITYKGVQHQRQRLGLKKKKGFQNIPTPEIDEKDLKPSADKDLIRVLGWLQQEPLSVGELSRRTDRSKESIIKIIDELHKKGYDVTLEPETRQVSLARKPVTEFKPIKIEPLYRSFVTVGFVSDTHYGSTCQQPSLLHRAYKVMEKEKVDFVVHTGDLTDGKNVYRGQDQEIFIPERHFLEKLEAYTVRHYPKTDKFKTYITGGNHDYSLLRKYSYNIIRKICKRRKDLVWRKMGQPFQVKGLNFRLLHFVSAAYAKSYRGQKMIIDVIADVIEDIRADRGKFSLPDFYCGGGLHFYCSFREAGVWVYTLPCFQSATRYFKEHGWHPDVGFVILKVHFDPKGHVIGEIEEKRYIWNSLIKQNDY